MPVLNVLIGHGKHVNLFDKKKRTPLFLASKNGCVDAVEALLNNGGNPFLQDLKDKNPLEIATNPLIKKMLVEKMDVNIYN